MLNFESVFGRTKDCHISDFRATNFANFLPLLTTESVGGGYDAD